MRVKSIFAAILFALPSFAFAADLRPRLDSDLASMKTTLVNLRHELHQNPELSNREVWTSKRIADELRAAGIPVETGIAKNGVIATIKCAKPGKTVAVRADIDALPINETMDVPYKSKIPGVKHACGHDIHTTIAIGVAELLWKHRSELSGMIVVFFQPAEEGPPPGEEGGAPLMIKEGFLDRVKPDAMFALHVWPPLQVGNVGFTPGAEWASSDRFKITITGKQSHGAQPHLGIDPIVTGAQIVMALQTIDSRRIDPIQPVVVTVGSFHSGTRFNIVPPTAELEGTFRTLDTGVRSQTRELITKLSQGIATANGASAELWFQDDAANPVLVNDAKLSGFAEASLDKTFGAEHVKHMPPAMVAEDFAHFAERVPSFYFLLGVSNPAKGITGNVHTAEFDADEDAIAIGAKAMVNLVVDYLSAPAKK